ncbi:hypothetical protein BV25DRAFT_1515950 [Artomyces pyxidatus]|uniref:Uncharacterized protein n=1 Tax=Artomyces pyxidatus TaxID=48021 RepID=A0ACB8TD70_9AGAM|nr:hypothetical protein BV25DRAFT_1515950 [Artomyces pyxidatus]
MADTFQLFVDDTSPSLSYFPFADTLGAPNPLAGWNPYYTGSGYANPPGEQGNGTSLHITSLDQASFALQWFGTGIQLFGNVTAASYDLTLDGHTNGSISSFSSDPTLLAAYDGLPQGNHTLSLTFHNPTNSTSSLIAIDNALITVSTQSPNCTVATNLVQDTSLPFVGEWSFLSDTSLSTADTTFHTSTNAGDQVSLNFTGSAVSVLGIRDLTSGHYTVQLDNETIVLDGASSFRESAALFFIAGLDRESIHTLTITNSENRDLTIGAVNITTLSGEYYPNPPMSSRLSPGTIAAITVASVLGFIVACLALLCLWRRRRRLSILHRRRMFAASSPSAHSNVLDIAPGPMSDPYNDEEKPPEKPIMREGSGGSLSFTLDLPIQPRPSQTTQYSGNSAQELPRSPTVSGTLSRPQALHTREGSRGALLQDISTSDGVYIGLREQSPFHVEFGSRSRQSSEGDVLTIPALPQVNVIASTPARNAEAGPLSFLDISSSRASSMRPSASSSSSSSARSYLRRISSQSFGPTRPISLPFAMQYHRNSSLGIPERDLYPDSALYPDSELASPPPTSSIRPLPRIPHSPLSGSPQPEPEPEPPTPHSPPTLHVQTQFRALPSMIPRTISATSPSTSPPSAYPLLRLRPPAASPTESVPVTVSDIHFRHSASEEEEEEEEDPTGRRDSARPPHPPLPGGRGYASPFIMQKLLGGNATLGAPGEGQASGSEGLRYAPGLGTPARRQ